MLLRALVLAATRQEEAEGKTPIQVLEGIIVGRFTSDFAEGKTVISTAEADGNVSFQLAADLSPADVIALAMEAIAWIRQNCADPAAPTDDEIYPPRVLRLRGSFRKAVIS